MNNIVIFDGVCNLCNWSVQFIIKRDPHGVFKFASAQSSIGEELLREHGIQSVEPESVILLKNSHIYEKSSAALLIAAEFNGLWKYLSVLRFMPRHVRDGVYDWFWHNRYRWFGKQDTCMMPTEAQASRFL